MKFRWITFSYAWSISSIPSQKQFEWIFLLVEIARESSENRFDSPPAKKGPVPDFLSSFTNIRQITLGNEFYNTSSYSFQFLPNNKFCGSLSQTFCALKYLIVFNMPKCNTTCYPVCLYNILNQNPAFQQIITQFRSVSGCLLVSNP